MRWLRGSLYGSARVEMEELRSNVKYIREYLFPPCRRTPAFQTVVPLVILEQIPGSSNVWSCSACNYRMTLFGETSLKDGVISSEVTPETQTRGEIAPTSFVCV